MSWKTSRIIRSYILREILISTLLTTLALSAVLLYANLAKHDDALLQALTFSPIVFAELVFLLFPYALSMGLPFGFSLSLLFCVGRWSADREITALYSLGFHAKSWKFPIYAFSLCVCLISCFASLVWAPLARSQFDERKRELAWENLHQLAKENIEIVVDLSKNKVNGGMPGLTGLLKTRAEKAVLSVGHVEHEKWKNLRISMLDTDDNFLAVIHAKTATLEKDDLYGMASLELSQVDVETFDSREENASNPRQYVSFEKWNHPFELPFYSKGSTKLSPKRTPIHKWGTLLFDKSKELPDSAWAHLNKTLYLSCSPFFLSFLLIPLGISKGRKDGMSNLFIGASACFLFYLLGFLGSQILKNGEFGWWLPTFLCFLNLLLKIDKQ
jgi:lipopolysaccharide export LptBFGC system permease protein LptF